MIDKVKSVIDKYGMLKSGSTVVVGVSGGSDSMALLYILCSLKNEYGIGLIAAHVNHGLRGESADRDERFVSDYCTANGIEFHSLKADVAAMAKESGRGFEECGRQIRYDFFNSFGDNIIIATAHNLSDRAETFLFNFARGSSLRGLCSIPAVRGNIIRPLIECTKDEINAFCKENSIDYVTDETNSDVAYSRNRIRHNVVTQLKSINPSFEKSVSRCINSLNEDEEYLTSLAKVIADKSKSDGGYLCSVLLEAALPVMKRALVMIVEENTGVTPEYRSLEATADILRNGGKIQINGGVTVRVRKGVLDFPKISDGPCDIRIETEAVNIKETNNLQNISKEHLEYYLDYDKIHGKVFVRVREEGDKISLASRNCTKSLKKLFNELAVPPEKRDSIAVVADDNGLLILEGVGVDRRAVVTSETERILIVRIKKSLQV